MSFMDKSPIFELYLASCGSFEQRNELGQVKRSSQVDLGASIISGIAIYWGTEAETPID
jgi:hypothetical protein